MSVDIHYRCTNSDWSLVVGPRERSGSDMTCGYRHKKVAGILVIQCNNNWVSVLVKC